MDEKGRKKTEEERQAWKEHLLDSALTQLSGILPAEAYRLERPSAQKQEKK